MSSGPSKIKDRYELREVLGRGGMGVVYRAYDTLMRREVALKTLLDVGNQRALDLFYKEWGVQASIVHPNVIEIYDIGAFEENGVHTPFFVMPLLPGQGLDQLIREGSPRLTIERCVSIFGRACLGLQAAHDRGLIHRDFKPQNVFVMDDDSVKIIDFGIAHLVDTSSHTSLKGTLAYMAPEQLRMEKPTVRSDIFSVGVSCYEAMTRRRPFQGSGEQELSLAIMTHIPLPASELNSAVNESISRVLHKALAKNPWHRFGSAVEFAEALNKACRNEPLPMFDGSAIKPRVERAAKAFEQGNYEFASEVLSELESEGQLEPEIVLLRRRLDHAVRKSKIQKLLESTRRFKEAKEHGVALRKVQEALDLDPDDTDALALKHGIEKEQREKQIYEWLQLAREHLQNEAFGPAREAIQKVLEIQPNEPEALRMATDISRLEKERERARRDKERLYESALQLWERGEVSAALTRLEDLIKLESNHSDTASGRGGTYQKLYQEVRSEQDELRNSYDQARSLLAEAEFDQALEICRQRLTRYPNHALFQSLKFDIEQRRQQKLSAYMADVDRRVEEEKDLDRRVAILQEALGSYPNEERFQTASKLAREKRDLVQGIVSKAQYLEERGQVQEALDQWQTLRTIHSGHPGVDFEVERLRKKRAQQKTQESKHRWVEMIDGSIESSDYERAEENLESALGEFPDDEELVELRNIVVRGKERAEQSSKLLTDGRDAIEAGKWDEGLDLIREAHGVDERNSIVRAVLVSSLVQRAGAVAETSAPIADKLLDEALAADPNDSAAASLKRQIADQRRERFVTRVVAEARKLQASDRITEAREMVQKGLGIYPNEVRLKNLLNTLQSRTTIRDRQAPVAEPASDQAIGAQQAASPPAKRAAEERHTSPNAVTMVVETPGARTAKESSPGPKPKPKRKPGPSAVEALRASIAGKEKQVALGFAGLAALLVIAFAISRIVNQEAAPTAAAFPVTVQSSPPGAQISIDGRPCGESACQESLSEGAHTLEARMPGFLTASMPFEIQPESPPGDQPIVLVLDPVAPRLEIVSDLEAGRVLLNQEAIGKLEDGAFAANELPEGQHTLEINDRGAKIVLKLSVRLGYAPEVLSLETRNLKALAVAGLGREAVIYSDQSGSEATLDGSVAGVLTDAGLTLSGLSEGGHEIVSGPEDARTQVVFDSGLTPVLAAFLKSDRNVGSVRVVTDEDDATIFLNDAPYRRKTQHGRVVIYLVPGVYKLRVEKPGFRTSSPEKTIEIVKGRQVETDFELKPLPQMAGVSIRSGVPGAEVLLDGKGLGLVRPDGSFSSSNISPGKHRVTLRKEFYAEKEIEHDWRQGEKFEIDGALAALRGTLAIKVSPPEVTSVTITLTKDGETATSTLTERTIQLLEGTYDVTGSAPGYESYTSTLRIVPNQTKTAELLLKKNAGVVPDKADFSLDGWVRDRLWKREGNIAVRRGGDYVLAPTPAGAGDFRYTVLLQRGRRLQWVANYVDEKNHILFRLDSKNFESFTVIDGKETKIDSKPVRANLASYLSFQVEVRPGRIIHRLRDGGDWEVLDDRPLPEGAPPRGQFGFRIPGSDQLALSYFEFFQQ